MFQRFVLPMARKARVPTTCQIVHRAFSQVEMVRRSLTLEDFRAGYFGKVPVVLKNHFGNLPALACWTPNNYQHLRQYGDTFVSIELSKGTTSYASSDSRDAFEKTEVPLTLFLDFLNHYEASMRQGINMSDVRIYLAQHALFDSLPELYRDVCQSSHFAVTRSGRRCPMYTTAGTGDIYNVNVWIGVSTHSPLHHDPYHNIFVQLFSKKRVVLFPPHAKSQLRMHTEALLKNTSQIGDIFDPALVRELPDAVQELGVQAHLEPGDGLYVPEGWVHSFKGDSGISGSVNWWFR